MERPILLTLYRPLLQSGQQNGMQSTSAGPDPMRVWDSLVMNMGDVNLGELWHTV